MLITKCISCKVWRDNPLELPNVTLSFIIKIGFSYYEYVKGRGEVLFVVGLFIGTAFLVQSLFSRNQWIMLLLALAGYGMYFQVWENNGLLFCMFIMGIVLIVLEFYIPDYGIVGILGLIATVVSLYLYTNSITGMLFHWILATIVFVVMLIINFHLGRTLQTNQQFVLQTQLNRQSGYSSTPIYHDLEGKEAVVVEVMRPVGRILLDTGEMYQAISQSGFIEVDEVVTIVKISGQSIYVRNKEA